MLQTLGLDGGPHLPSQARSPRAVGRGQQAGKFLAAAAATRSVGRVTQVASALATLDQALVALRMAVVVVVGLEMVYVDGNQRQRCLFARSALPFLGEAVVKATPVADAGEVVLRGQLFEQVAAALFLARCGCAPGPARWTGEWA